MRGFSFSCVKFFDKSWRWAYKGITRNQRSERCLDHCGSVTGCWQLPSTDTFAKLIWEVSWSVCTENPDEVTTVSLRCIYMTNMLHCFSLFLHHHDMSVAGVREMARSSGEVSQDDTNGEFQMTQDSSLHIEGKRIHVATLSSSNFCDLCYWQNVCGCDVSQ